MLNYLQHHEILGFLTLGSLEATVLVFIIWVFNKFGANIKL